MIWGLRFSFFLILRLCLNVGIKITAELLNPEECYNNDFHSYQQPFSVNVL